MRHRPPSKPSSPINRPRPADHRFGQGILAFIPWTGRMPFTVADEAEAVQLFAAAEPDYDRLAGEALAVDRMSVGLYA